MGQIIAFPLPPTPYPDLAADLDLAECILLIAIRWRVISVRHQEDPIPRLCQALKNAGAVDAAFSIDGLMTVVSRVVTRPVDIHCPRCPGLSRDEQHLLRAASLMQAGDRHLAEKVLRTTLLSAQGAEFALGPLEGLGALFSRARLFLSRHRFTNATTGDRLESSPPRSLH
jgi:hypothetical protein